jgi:hypothetical protein
MPKTATKNKLSLDLHPKQLEVFNNTARTKVVLAGRGFGKSVLLLTTGIYKCATNKAPINPRYPQVGVIIMPTLKQARAIHWLPLVSLLENSPLVDHIDKTDFRIVFKGTTMPDLLLRGADRGGDRLRSLSIFWAGLDEFQDFDPNILDKVLRPALSRNRGWSLLIIGTPKGKLSHFYKVCQTALLEAKSQFWHFFSRDNPFLDKQEIADAERELPPKVFRQEYEASWESFSSQIIEHLEACHKLKTLPINYRIKFLSCDLGDINPALTVTGLTHDGSYYVLDYWENLSGLATTDVEFTTEAQRLCVKWQCHLSIVPDDRPSVTKLFRQSGDKSGVIGMKKALMIPRSKPGPMEGFQILDSLFYQNRLFISEKHERIYDSLSSLKRTEMSDGTFLNKVCRGDNHLADALRYGVASFHSENLGRL